MTAKLRTDPAIADPDRVYEALMALHRDLTPEESRRADAALILLLANQLGDEAAVLEAVSAARRVVRDEA